MVSNVWTPTFFKMYSFKEKQFTHIWSKWWQNFWINYPFNTSSCTHYRIHITSCWFYDSSWMRDIQCFSNNDCSLCQGYALDVYLYVMAPPQWRVQEVVGPPLRQADSRGALVLVSAQVSTAEIENQRTEVHSRRTHQNLILTLALSVPTGTSHGSDKQIYI